MAEAVSLAASVAGLASLLIQLTQVSSAYLTTVSSASTAQQSYLHELNALGSAVSKIENALAVSGLEVNIGARDEHVSEVAIERYKQQLTKLHAKLEKNLARSGPLAGLKKLGWPFEEKETKAVVDMLHRFRGVLDSALTAEGFQLSAKTFQRLESMRNEQLLAKFLSWTLPTARPLSLNAVMETYCEGTSMEVLQDQAFLDWRDGTEQLLWLSGKPGCGKTMVASKVVQDLMENAAPGSVVSYHFFRTDNTEDSVDNLCRSLLSQILPQVDEIPQKALDYFSKFKQGFAPPTDKLWDIMLAAKAPLVSIFLLARLAMDIICTQISVADIRIAISELPSTYEQGYKCSFDRILKQTPALVSLAKRTLTWVSHARRPLTTAELRHAIAIQPGTNKLDSESLVSPELILSSCIGLVSLSKSDGRVFMVHSTARQYFITNEQDTWEDTPMNIAKACLTYLSLDEMGSGPCESASEVRARLDKLPFLDYCARNWGNHVLQFQKALEGSLKAFLNDKSLRESSWQLLHRQLVADDDDDSQSAYLKLQSRNPQPLHVAAYWGFVYIFEMYINGYKWNSDRDSREAQFSKSDSNGWTPLHWASSMGFEECVRVILAVEVDINAKDNLGWTPLMFAVIKGHIDVVNLLLQRGANPETVDKLNMTPLQWAKAASHEEVVQVLQASPSPEAMSISSMSLREALDLAFSRSEPRRSRISKYGELDTVTIRFDDINTLTDQSQLQEVLEDCTEKLAQSGSVENLDIKTENHPELWGTFTKLEALNYYHSREDQPSVGLGATIRKQLLELAILQENLHMVKLLVKNDSRLQKEVPYGFVGWYGRTCLHTVAYGKDSSIASFLIEEGADPNVKDAWGRTPLHLACAFGSFEVVKALVESKGVDVNVADGRGRTALHWCCNLGGWRQESSPGANLQICQLLLDSGVLTSAVDGSGNTVMHFASVLRDEAVIRLLLSRGVPTSVKNRNGLTPLHIVAGGSTRELRNRVDLPFTSHRYDTRRPTEEQARASLHLLLAQANSGELGNIAEENSHTPLDRAINGRTWKFAQVLAEHGFVYTGWGTHYRNIWHALWAAPPAVFRLILEHKPEKPYESKGNSAAGLLSFEVYRWDQTYSNGEFPNSLSLSNDDINKALDAILEILSLSGPGARPISLKDKMDILQKAIRASLPAPVISKLLRIDTERSLSEEDLKNLLSLAFCRITYPTMNVLIQYFQECPDAPAWLKTTPPENYEDRTKNEKLQAQHYLRTSGATTFEDDSGQNVLHHAAALGNVAAATAIIDLGADVNSRDKKGLTPLHCAIDAARTEMVQLLLQSGASLDGTVECETPYNGTAVTADMIHFALCRPSLDILQILVEQGPNTQTPFRENIGGSHTAFEILSQSRPTPLVAEFILDHGATLTKENFEKCFERTWHIFEYEDHEGIWDRLRSEAVSKSNLAS